MAEATAAQVATEAHKTAELAAPPTAAREACRMQVLTSAPQMTARRMTLSAFGLSVDEEGLEDELREWLAPTPRRELQSPAAEDTVQVLTTALDTAAEGAATTAVEATTAPEAGFRVGACAGTPAALRRDEARMEAMLKCGAAGDAAATFTSTPSSGGGGRHGGRALPRLSFFLRTPPSTHRKTPGTTPGGSAGRRLSHASHLFRAGRDEREALRWLQETPGAHDGAPTGPTMAAATMTAGRPTARRMTLSAFGLSVDEEGLEDELREWLVDAPTHPPTAMAPPPAIAPPPAAAAPHARRRKTIAFVDTVHAASPAQPAQPAPPTRRAIRSSLRNASAAPVTAPAPLPTALPVPVFRASAAYRAPAALADAPASMASGEGNGGATKLGGLSKLKAPVRMALDRARRSTSRLVGT